MTEHSTVFLSVFLPFLGLLVITGTVYLRRARQVSGGNAVDLLLARLIAVDSHKLARVAADLDRSTSSDGEPELESWQVWDLAGGLEGIEALAANCEILIDLACHVQQWYPEALPVAEQLRLHAREIQWHLERLKGAQQRGRLQAAYPEYAQRAVAIYYGMTRHVLALYEMTNRTDLGRLQAAL